jgi:hypothetical protein
LHDLGCRHFAVFFDDIDEGMNDEDSAMFHGNFAAAQVHVANKTFAWLNGAPSLSNPIISLLINCNR